MMRLLTRAVAGSVVGALGGALCLAIAFAVHPDLIFAMDRDLGRSAKGFYPGERSGQTAFAWTSRRAEITLPGFDRRAPWLCSLRFRGARPDRVAQPAVDFAVDGVTLARTIGTNEFQDLEVTAPAQPSKQGLTLTVASSLTFLPGGADRRELGVQIDRLACRPTGVAVALPPRRAIVAAMLAAAMFGAALSLIGLTATTVIGATLLLTLAQAVPLSTGLAPYTSYEETAVWLALWIALAILAAVKGSEWWNGRPLRQTAKFAAVFSGAALYLRLLSLLHPSKPLVDALFHAHRLEWVMAGRFYFTQPMPSGVRFPYAIGLYLFAAPWSLLTHDHVTLLRIVVCATEAIAGALLYPMIVRIWGDRLMAAVAVGLFNLVPLSYVVVGNANLTNAFGQSVALVTLVTATIWPLGRGDWWQLVALILLATLALLSHISTAVLLLTTLLATAVFYRWKGDPTLAMPARSVLIATAIAVVISVVTYYGHFTDVYKSAARVQSGSIAAGVSNKPPQAPAAPGIAANRPPSASAPTPLQIRMVNGMAMNIEAVGLPIFILATIGAWHVWKSQIRDRLALVLAAWGVAFVVFFLVGVMAPVDVPFQRYAAEFVGRIDYATYPAAVILAARGATWAWRAGMAARLASAVLLFFAVVYGVQQWTSWMA